MKKAFIILLIITLHFSNLTKGQNILGSNLVNNPSFEDYYSCPTFSTQLYQCKYWWGYSTEYYNSCATTFSNVSIPLNGAGFQYAHSGVAYAGACIYSNTNPIYDYRERMKTKLSDSLITNKRYCTNLFISLAEYTYNSFFTNIIILDSIGLLFTNDSVTDNDTAFFFNGVRVQNNILNIDTISWFKKSNSFIANGGEKYLTIGNFDNNINWSNSAIYVYIDDVSVCECNFEFNLGKDTTLCEGEILILSPNIPNVIYTWQDSSHVATYKVNKTGTYWVRAYFPDYGITTSSSINVTFNGDCIKIPNIFTPNNDNKNDYFVITNTEGWNIDLQVFNRWGIKVFQDNNYKNNWDGKDNGNPLADGVYYYVIKATNQESGIFKNYNGSVTILR